MTEEDFKAYTALLQNSFETRRGNVAEGLFAVADAVKDLAKEVRRLGEGDEEGSGSLDDLRIAIVDRLDDVIENLKRIP